MISYDIFLWLTLFSMIISKSIHVAANGINPFFLWLRNIPVVSIYHLFYPFLCQWTFRLLPRLGYCKQCYNEHCAACFFSNSRFSPEDRPMNGIVGYYDSSTFSF